MTDFQSLIARVEAGTGPDRELNRDICVALGFVPSGFPHVLTAPRLTASLDACLALQKHVLPGWRWYADDAGEAYVWRDFAGYLSFQGEGADPCRAWLGAILRAVSAQKEQADGGRT